MFVSSTGLREQRQEQASRIEAERWPRTPDFSVYFPLPPSLVASGLNLIYLLLHVHVNVPVFSDPEHSRSHKLTHKVNASTFWIFIKKKKKNARSLRDSCIIGVWMIVQSFVKKMKRDKCPIMASFRINFVNITQHIFIWKGYTNVFFLKNYIVENLEEKFWEIIPWNIAPIQRQLSFFLLFEFLQYLSRGYNIEIVPKKRVSGGRK